MKKCGLTARVIFMSAYGVPPVGFQFSDGIVDWLEKPFRLEALTAAVERALETGDSLPAAEIRMGEGA